MPYRVIDPAETLENAPLTAFLGDAFRQNEVAVRRGEEDAPRLQWKWITGSQGAGSTTISGLGQWQGGLFLCRVNSTNPVSSFTVAFSTDGVTFGAGITVQGKDSGAVDNVVIIQERFFDFTGGTVITSGTAMPGASIGTSGVITHMRITRTAGSGQLSWMFHLQGGYSVF